MLVKRLEQLGYHYKPADVEVYDFHQAVKSGNLVFTSGQTPALNGVGPKGKVGDQVDLETAYQAAEVCAYKCLQAVGSVSDINHIVRIVKVFGMVNVSQNFTNTSGVINGATHFLNKLFPGTSHARSAVGMHIPNDWAVEIDMIVEIKETL